MDLFRPLKTMPSGKIFIMCVTDAFSKYVELFQTKMDQQWALPCFQDGCADKDYHLRLSQIMEKIFTMK